MTDTSLLDKIFAIEEKQVETFADVVEINSVKFCPNEVIKLKRTHEYVTSRQKYIEITHGYHEDQYVWHIKPWHPKKNWSVSIDRVVYAIAVILNKYIPKDILIDTFMPSEAWDIKEITIKANDIRNHWSVSEEDLSKVTGQMFEILNTLT